MVYDTVGVVYGTWAWFRIQCVVFRRWAWFMMQWVCYIGDGRGLGYSGCGIWEMGVVNDTVGVVCGRWAWFRPHGSTWSSVNPGRSLR